MTWGFASRCHLPALEQLSRGLCAQTARGLLAPPQPPCVQDDVLTGPPGRWYLRWLLAKWNVLGRGVEGLGLFCSPLALQVPPAEALQADDAQSLALVGCPLPVAPPHSLEVHCRLRPLQGPSHAIGPPAGLRVEGAFRGWACAIPATPSPGPMGPPATWMVTAARLICRKCLRSSTIRNQLCRNRIFRTTSRCSVSCRACLSVSFRKTWEGWAQEAGSAWPLNP